MTRGGRALLLAVLLSWLLAGWAGWRYGRRLVRVEPDSGVVLSRVRGDRYRVRLSDGGTAEVVIAPAAARRLGLRPGGPVLLARKQYPWGLRGDWYVPPY